MEVPVQNGNCTWPRLAKDDTCSHRKKHGLNVVPIWVLKNGLNVVPIWVLKNGLNVVPIWVLKNGLKNGLNVVPIWVLQGPSVYYMGT